MVNGLKGKKKALSGTGIRKSGMEEYGIRKSRKEKGRKNYGFGRFCVLFCLYY